MFRFAKWLLCVAALAGVVMLGTANPVRADFGIELTLTDGTDTTSAYNPISGSTVATINPTITIGNISVTDAGGTSNSPGTSGGAESSEGVSNFGNIAISNTGSTPVTLTIIISATGFTEPSTAPLNLFDTVSGTVQGGTVSGTAVGYVDTNNTLYGAAPEGSPLPGSTSSTFIAGQTLSFSTPPQSFSDSGTILLTSNLPTPYSITFVETLTLSGEGSLIVTGGDAQVTPTPEPATMMAAFTAIPFLGLGAWMRRRKKAA